MAIIATYKDSALTVENAYIRVERIWGSKKEGWNAWIHVYRKEGDEKPATPVFSVNAPYVEGQNPFEALYKAIETLPFIEIPGKEDVVKEEKKPRGKKVKA